MVSRHIFSKTTVSAVRTYPTLELGLEFKLLFYASHRMPINLVSPRNFPRFVINGSEGQNLWPSWTGFRHSQTPLGVPKIKLDYSFSV